MSDRPTYRLLLTPAGDGPPPVVRLRALLKAALRSYGLRCTHAVEVPAGAPADARAGAGPGPEEEGRPDAP